MICKHFSAILGFCPFINILYFYLIFLCPHGKLAIKQSASAEKEEKNMKCKHCDADLAQWGAFCPVCGKSNTGEEEPLQQPVFDENEEIELPVLHEEEPLPEMEPEEEGPSPKLKKAKRLAAMSGCVAVLAVLATVLFFGIRGGWDVDSWFNWLKPRENTIQYKDSYTVKDKKAAQKGDVVVATMGEHTLTNAQLQIYYWQEIYDFLNNNYYYLQYFQLDYTQPLDEQTCYFDNTMTWQQYFLKSAIEVWQSNMAFAQLAKENNYVMPEEYRTSLDSMASELEKQAVENGFANADAMVKESYGAGCTLQDYMQYMESYYLGYLYFAELYNAIDPTLEEIEAYFLANEEALAAEGIKKDGTYTVDIRHILIKIDTVAAEMDKNETDDEGTDAQDEDETDDEYTEAHWEACRKAAQDILDAYLAGELTEERFGELAKEHSEDGNAEDGGIYTHVAEGEMVETFNDWCFDTARKAGDTGLVKTQFGYHVMYFVGSEESWITQTRSALISEESNKIVANELDKYTVEVNYKKIVLANVSL